MGTVGMDTGCDVEVKVEACHCPHCRNMVRIDAALWHLPVHGQRFLCPQCAGPFTWPEPWSEPVEVDASGGDEPAGEPVPAWLAADEDDEEEAEFVPTHLGGEDGTVGGMTTGDILQVDGEWWSVFGRSADDREWVLLEDWRHDGGGGEEVEWKRCLKLVPAALRITRPEKASG